MQALSAAFDEAVALDKPYEAERLADDLEAAAASNVAARAALEARAETVRRVREDARELTRLLSEIKSDEGWTKSYDRKGIKVFFKKQEGTPFLVTKAAKVFPAVAGKPATYTFMALVSLFAEVELMPKYFPRGLLRTHETLKEETKFSRFTRLRIHPPMLMPISNREAVIEGKGFDMTERSAICIAFKSLPQDFERDGFVVPEPGSGYTRIDISGAYYVEIRPDGSCLVENIQFLDLKLSFVPPIILNTLSKGALPVEFLNNLTKKFLEYDGSDWERRVAERPQIYEDVRLRLEALLQREAEKADAASERPDADDEESDLPYFSARDGDHDDDEEEGEEDQEDEDEDDQDDEEDETDDLEQESDRAMPRASLRDAAPAARRESAKEHGEDLEQEEVAPPERRLRWGLRSVLQSVLEYVLPEEEAETYADKATEWIEPCDRRSSLARRLSKRRKMRKAKLAARRSRRASRRAARWLFADSPPEV